MPLRPPLTGPALLFMAALLVPLTSRAQVAPKAAHGFRLHARAIGALTINNVYCGLSAIGEICMDSLNSSITGGGSWPKNSPMQYMYNSGFQIAGIIDPASPVAWAGDTAGAMFFSSRGGEHGSEVEPLWNYADAGDRDHWPAAAYVPATGPAAALYDPSLQGRPAASEGDVWALAWDGVPTVGSGRPHPVGIALETRGLGWNAPRGNEDILYFVHTFYNVSSACASDYSALPTAMGEKLRALGAQFQALNESKYGIDLPVCGYAIKDAWFGLESDPDVADAGQDYGSVNLPLEMGYAYDDAFNSPPGSYVLPPALGEAPFLNGFGFVGMKFLGTPLVGGEEAGLHLFSNYTGGGTFSTPGSVAQLYRYLSGAITPALGDGTCNYQPLTDRICFLIATVHSDIRQFQSTGPTDLPPGGVGLDHHGVSLRQCRGHRGVPDRQLHAGQAGEPAAPDRCHLPDHDRREPDRFADWLPRVRRSKC